MNVTDSLGLDSQMATSTDGSVTFNGLKPNTSYVLMTAEHHQYLLENQRIGAGFFSPSSKIVGRIVNPEKEKLPEPPNHHPLNNLRRGIETFAARSKVYGTNYRRVGGMMMSLFPNGLTLDCVEQWNRFGILFMILVKVSRYVIKPYEGHIDSAHDMSVYSAILEELTAEQQGFDVSPMPETYSKDSSKGCEHIWQYPCHKEHPARQCKPYNSTGYVVHSCGKPTCTACGERKEQ